MTVRCCETCDNNEQDCKWNTWCIYAHCSDIIATHDGWVESKSKSALLYRIKELEAIVEKLAEASMRGKKYIPEKAD